MQRLSIFYMLQALIHHKLKGAFTDTHFHHTEDTTTSSIIGLLQYLPDELVWKLLKSSLRGVKRDVKKRVFDLV